MWTARRILKDLADADRRRRIAAAFWKHADASAKAMAAAQLARSLHFRDETIRKMPADKKAELLASRAALPEFEQTLEAALMHYHTHEQNEMLGAFLDAWNIPHVNGSIETDDYTPPNAEKPPSTGTTTPVTKADAGDNNHSTVPIKSCGSPKRPIGV